MQVHNTIYPDLDQLVQDLLYLDALEEGVPEEQRMNVTVYVMHKFRNETQTYLWQTIS